MICAVVSACGGSGSGDGGTDDTQTGGASSASTVVVDPTEGDLVNLALPMLWMPAKAEADPLAAHRPAAVTCPLGGWLFEPTGLEVNTQSCNYGSFTQPALAEVVPGARIVGSLYHFDLVADPPASAHVALLVGDSLVWEQEVAIPGKANAFTIDVPANFAASAGTPVNFHLHNHGQNTWTLGALQVERFGP